MNDVILVFNITAIRVSKFLGSVLNEIILVFFYPPSHKKDNATFFICLTSVGGWGEGMLNLLGLYLRCPNPIGINLFLIKHNLSQRTIFGR